MNSTERVRAAMRFEGPDRVPVFRVGPGDVFPLAMMPSREWRPGHAQHEHGLFPFHCDDSYIGLRWWKWRDRPEWANKPEYEDWLSVPREEVDEFGAIWNRDGKNTSLGHPGRPVLPSWDEFDLYLERYSPDARDESRYGKFIRWADAGGGDRYRMCVLGFQGPFTMAGAIRGFTSFLTDHYRHADMLRRLLAHLTDFYVAAAHAWVEYGARPHGFMLYDDLGDQNRPFLRPKMFAEFYRPVFERIIASAHELGCELHLHSCGKIDPLIPALIDWGVDALELDSPRMIGYRDLEPFRGKIMLWGCIDIQQFYMSASPDECQREVWHMIRNMGVPQGGFGAYFYPQTYHLGIPDDNVEAFERGLEKYGNYQSIPAEWWDAPPPDFPAGVVPDTPRERF